MEAPKRIEPKGLADYLDVMSQAVFQSGMSWKVVEAKWPGTQEVFRGFDPKKLAVLSEPDIDAIASDTRIIRNRRKIEAIIGNGRRMLELEKGHGSFKNYLRSKGSFDELIKDLRKQFKFLGDMGAYRFLYVVGEDVPDYNTFCASHGIKAVADR
ncbi:MAG: DNA-3-methyladenine glycosylase I [Chloroflexi bacterium]|nr:DNA-3-methyladenine glycosylase I [Chloroflexota bacterium]